MDVIGLKRERTLNEFSKNQGSKLNCDLSILLLYSQDYTCANDFPFNLGAKAVYCLPLTKETKKTYLKAKNDGLTTIAHLSLCFDPVRASEHSDEVSVFYWFSDKIEADNNTVSILLLNNDYMDGQVRERPTDRMHDPEKYWYVFDWTDGRILSHFEWKPSDDYRSITILSKQTHIYQVAYLVSNVEKKGGVEWNYLDPKNPAYGIIPETESEVTRKSSPYLYLISPNSLNFQKHTLLKLETFLKEWKDYVDIIRVLLACRYTTFKDKNGNLYGGWDENGEKVPGWNWYGYGRSVHPENQIAFKKKTGIDFNIEWLLKSKYGQIKYPPAIEYLKWIYFINDGIINYHVKLSKLCAKYNVKLQTNIGDNWIGIEPYLDNFEQPEFHSIGMYGFGKTVANRMLTGFKSKTKRVLKIWFSSEAGSAHYGGNSLQKLANDWNNSKRALFFRLPDELRLEALNINTQASVKRFLKHIVDEFVQYKKFIGGCEIYCHPINIYILNCWGKLRAWTGWGDDAGESQNIIQSHLVDMPFNIKWVSFQEVSEQGIPGDCDILFNFGPRETSWSGDYMWKLPHVKQRVEDFVKQGGAFLGIDAPSFCDGKFALSELLGVTSAGENCNNRLQNLKQTNKHWISQELSENISVKSGMTVKVSEDKTIGLYSSDAQSSPSIYVREILKGRIGYLSSYSDASEYYQLLKRMFFWLCRKEDLAEAIHTSEPNVFLYFYKQENLLIVYNMSNLKKNVKIQFDLKLLNGGTKDSLMIRDIQNNCKNLKNPVSYMEFKNGMSIDIAPWEAKFLKIKLAEK